MQKRPTDASGCNRHLQEHIPTPRLNSWNRGNLTPATATTVPTQPAWGLGMGTQQLGSSAKVCGSRTPCGQAALLRPALGLPAGRRCSPVLYRPGRASIRPGLQCGLPVSGHTVRCFSSACIALLHGSAFQGTTRGNAPTHASELQPQPACITTAYLSRNSFGWMFAPSTMRSPTLGRRKRKMLSQYSSLGAASEISSACRLPCQTRLNCLWAVHQEPSLRRNKLDQVEYSVEHILSRPPPPPTSASPLGLLGHLDPQSGQVC